MGIREAMPTLARHLGEWEGEYVHLDAANTVIDRHASHLTCLFPETGPFAYHQVNRYRWADGRTEEIQFPATFADGQIWWDTERIHGRAWQADPRTIMLTWTRKDSPGIYLYEMIQISADNSKRARTWHWFEGDEIVKRTCVKERRIK